MRQRRCIRRLQRPRAPLPVEQILDWADRFRVRNGRWPNCADGPITWELSLTWSGVNEALRQGYRGLPGGSSIALLLAEQLGALNRRALCKLTEELILRWADDHHRRTGSWPYRSSGDVLGVPGETWGAVDSALAHGGRGLPGGTSLAQLLHRERGMRNIADLPPLTEKLVLAWADAHFRRTGAWPTIRSGAIPEASDGDTWLSVEKTLRSGRRGLPGNSSLHRFLQSLRRSKG